MKKIDLLILLLVVILLTGCNPKTELLHNIELYIDKPLVKLNEIDYIDLTKEFSEIYDLTNEYFKEEITQENFYITYKEIYQEIEKYLDKNIYIELKNFNNIKYRELSNGFSYYHYFVDKPKDVLSKEDIDKLMVSCFMINVGKLPTDKGVLPKDNTIILYGKLKTAESYRMPKSDNIEQNHKDGIRNFKIEVDAIDLKEKQD